MTTLHNLNQLAVMLHAMRASEGRERDRLRSEAITKLIAVNDALCRASAADRVRSVFDQMFGG